MSYNLISIHCPIYFSALRKTYLEWAPKAGPCHLLEFVLYKEDTVIPTFRLCGGYVFLFRWRSLDIGVEYEHNTGSVDTIL